MAEPCPKNRDTDFVTLIHAHDAHVRGILRLRGVHGADLDDMSQQVWLVALTYRDKLLASPETARGWLSEVARRRALDLHGTSWNSRIELIDAEELAELAIETGSGIEAAVILSEMLECLPDRYHEIMRLRALEWEIHEIAELYGLPWSTADSRWRSVCAELVGERHNG